MFLIPPAQIQLPAQLGEGVGLDRHPLAENRRPIRLNITLIEVEAGNHPAIFTFTAPSIDGLEITQCGVQQAGAYIKVIRLPLIARLKHQ